MAVGGNQVVLSPGLALVFLSPVSAVVEAGWVSPRYGTKMRAPVVCASSTGTDPRFITLIAPLPPSLVHSEEGGS